MEDCKPSATHMVSNLVLSATGDEVFEDPMFYKSIVRALQYIIFTRSNQSSKVNKYCQFIDASRMTYNHYNL